MRSAVRLLSMCVAVLLLGREAMAEPYETQSVDRKVFFFFRARPDMPTAKEQFQHALQLAKDGSIRSALRQLDYLAAFWPTAPEAPLALLERAALLRKQGKPEEAFDAYQSALSRYAGDVEYDGILEKQYAIAEEVKERRSAAWFGLPGFRTAERALPLYETIVTNGPAWSKTPEILVTIGEIQRENWQLDEAMTTFSKVVSGYPLSPWAERAAHNRALCAYDRSVDHPNHEDDAQRALADLQYYLDTFRDVQADGKSARVHQAMELKEIMRVKVADFAFKKAEFYDKIFQRPAAALAGYEAFLRNYAAGPRPADTDVSPALAALNEQIRQAEERIVILRELVTAKGATP